MKGVFILLLAGILVTGLLWEKRRRDRLARIAATIGFYLERGRQPIPDALDRAGFYLFTQGPPQVLNSMWGRRSGYEVTLFGYFFEAAFGDEGSRELPQSDGDGPIVNHGQTVAWIHSGSTRLPDFDLFPTGGPIRRAGPKSGLRPFTFGGREDFSRRYVLQGRDEEAIRKLFAPAVLDYLAAHPGLVVEGRGGQWIYYRPDNRVEPRQIPGFLEDVVSFFDLLSQADRQFTTPLNS